MGIEIKLLSVAFAILLLLYVAYRGHKKFEPDDDSKESQDNWNDTK